MTPDEKTAMRSPNSCSRCGSQSANAFGFEGLCLRCAGVRVLQMESGTPWPNEPEISGKPLERIGPYEIIEELGHGGMGRVYAARQILLGRIVALKTIREGINPELDIRFLREIQTVARLRHPFIVAIHDSGRANGSVYFSMDYIEGGDLAAHLKGEVPTPKRAALLMSKIADGLAYAHTEGILHRDLKPSNILLDGDDPKIADFGLAAEIAAGGDLTAITHVLGTPHYLAPEAMHGGSAAQTVASDIYAAGVILFEMLSGRTPFAGASAAELPSIAKDSDPPSIRLLSPIVPKELETICLKCLDREPERRYASAAEFGNDLRHFLAGEPINARPASVVYRFRKYARRHSFAIFCATLSVVVLIAATIVSLLMARAARQAERKSVQDSATSTAVISFINSDLLGQDTPDEQPNRGITLKEVLDLAAKKVPSKFKDQPEAEISIRETLAGTYDRLGDYQAEVPQIHAAIEARMRGTGKDDGAEGLGTLTDMEQESLLNVNLGNTELGKNELTHVVSVFQRIYGPNAKQTLHAMTDMIYIDQVTGNIPEAEALAKDMVRRDEKVMGSDADETLTAESDLSSMYYLNGQLPEAEALNLKVLASFKRTVGPDKPQTLTSMANLAAVYWVEDKTQQAEAMDIDIVAIRSRILGPEHPETLRSLSSLGAAYRADGKIALADAANSRAYNERLKLLGPEHNDTLASMANLSLVKMEEGKFDEADKLETQCYETAKKSLGPGHFTTLGALIGLSEIKRREGKLAKAEALRSDLTAIRIKKGGPDSLNALIAATGLGQIQLERGEYQQAEATLRSVQPGWAKITLNHWRQSVSKNLWGAALVGEGKFSEGEPLLLSSVDALEHERSEIPPIERRVITESQERIATAYHAVGRDHDAELWAKKAKTEKP